MDLFCVRVSAIISVNYPVTSVSHFNVLRKTMSLLRRRFIKLKPNIDSAIASSRRSTKVKTCLMFIAVSFLTISFPVVNQTRPFIFFGVV